MYRRGCRQDHGLYRGPSVDQYIEKFTTEEDGHLAIENDILLGYDFFVSEGKYTAEQRDAWAECPQS